ncbi:MAG TPA: hypothetical protein DDZ05_03660 [Candidatus Blackburnbacteria bacterium]|nr:hypothetical protein [Candidatus Blackburnbacteria bacterium]
MVNSNQKIEIAFHLNTKDATPLQTWPEVEPDDWGGVRSTNTGRYSIQVWAQDRDDEERLRGLLS